MNKIWCLFSIANDYDQPRNNLVKFWFKEPGVVDIADAIFNKKIEELEDEKIIGVVDIKKGKEYTDNDMTYRIQGVSEDDILEARSYE